MNALETAIKLDINEQFVEAAERYEEAIQVPDVPLDAFLNLAVLYWEFTDFGGYAHYGFPWEFFANGYKWCMETLNAAEERFGPDARILFWRQYIAFIFIGDPQPSVEEYIELSASGRLPLDAYSYVYINTKDPQYLPQVKHLLENADQQPITRNRYTAGILTGAVKRYKHESLLSKL